MEVEDAFRVGGGLNGQMGKIVGGLRKEGGRCTPAAVRVNPIAHAKVPASAVRKYPYRCAQRNINHKSWFCCGVGWGEAWIALPTRFPFRTKGKNVGPHSASKPHLFDMLHFKLPLKILPSYSLRRCCHRILPMWKSALCIRCASCSPAVRLERGEGNGEWVEFVCARIWFIGGKEKGEKRMREGSGGR